MLVVEVVPKDDDAEPEEPAKEREELTSVWARIGIGIGIGIAAAAAVVSTTRACETATATRGGNDDS